MTPAGSIDRMATTPEGALERFVSSGALSKGRVNLISLAAIVERLGGRWSSRQDAVYEMAERVLDRKFGEDGDYLRVSESDYLVAQPGRDPFAGQVCCMRALREILTHFLGAAVLSDLRVLQVTEICDNQIVARQIDLVKVQEAEGHDAALLPQARLPKGAGLVGNILSPERWAPFVASSGRKLRVSCKLEPVFELKFNRRIGYRLQSRIIDMATGEALLPSEVSSLSRADHTRIDMATITRGLARMAGIVAAETELSLIIPVSYVTLSHHEGRSLVSEALTSARHAVVKGVLCEVLHIEGVPQVALLSAVSMIKPWSLLVVGHLSDVRAASGAMKEAGLQALSINRPNAIEGDAEFVSWLRGPWRTLIGPYGPL
jgi:hypothetical protein